MCYLYSQLAPYTYFIGICKSNIGARSLIKKKNNSEKSLCKSKDFIELQNLALDISEMISIRKNEYYDHLSKKLISPNISAKNYRLILKSFHKSTNVLLIPPPLLVNNKIGSDFTEKANFFNDFFASQCTPISNNSELPSRKYCRTNKDYTNSISKMIMLLSLGT